MKSKPMKSVIQKALITVLLLIYMLAVHTDSLGLGSYLIAQGEIIIWIFVTLALVNITYLYHLNRRYYGPDHTDDFFNFPVNFLVSMMTIVMVYQIGFNRTNAKYLDRKSHEYTLSQLADDVVIDTWELNPMQHTALNPLYEQIMGRQKGSNGLMRFKSEYEWHQVYPNLSYAPFEANELQWHYAVAFCQEMINVIRMFDLTHRFRIGNPSDLDRSITDTFSGWLVTFRIHMKNPFVRQVWLTNQTRHGNPEISAWVQYYVTDPIDADPDYFIKHQSRWDHEVAKILNRPLPTLTPTQKAILTDRVDH